MNEVTWAYVIAGLALGVIVWLVTRKRKDKTPDNYIPGSPKEPKGPRNPLP